MKQLLARFRYFVATLLFLLTTAMSSGGAVFALNNSGGSVPGDNGTVKIKSVGSDAEDPSNEPHVACNFYLDAFNFDTLQSVSWTIYSKPPTGNHTEVLNGSLTLANGTGQSDDLTLPAGHYKLVWNFSGENGDAKHKVFWVDECTENVTPTTPTVTTPSCQDPSMIVTPPAITGIIWTPAGSTTLQPGESVTYTAAADTANGYVLAANVTTSFPFTNNFDTTNCPHLAVAATPQVTPPSCENPSMIVTPTTSEGVVWSPSTSTTLNPGQSQTYTASAATNYYFGANQQTSFPFTNNFDSSTCPKQAVLSEPTASEPNCEIRTMTVTLHNTEGVVWNPSMSVVLAPGATQKFTASAAPNYYFAQGQKTEFTFTNTFNPSTCGCGCETSNVTAEVPQFKDVCGYENDTYTIPRTEHVKYYVNGSVVAATAGTYHVTSGQTITVMAVADANYHLTNGPTWTFTFTDKDCKPCVKKVRVPHVKIHDVCGTKDDTFTVPSKTGVAYKINGQILGAGTYKANDYVMNGDITVEAVAMPGYTLKGSVHTWTYHFTNEPCGGGGGEQNTPVTPGAVTFNEVCETANDTYTIPATPGVTYKVNGVVTAAGTYHATGTVTVTAEANVGYVLNGTATWTHTFTNEACAGSGGQVLGESFTLTPGKGAVAATELANTGQNSLASAIVAFVIATSSILVYAFSPRRHLGNS